MKRNARDTTERNARASLKRDKALGARITKLRKEFQAFSRKAKR